MNASTALLQALLARGDYLESLSQLECLKILPILESAHDEILGKIAKTNGEWTREWLQEMAGEIDEIYKAAADKAFGKVQPDLEKIAINEGAWTEAEASKILVGFSLTSPAPSLLKAVLDLPTSIGGSTLEDLFDALAINSRKAAYSAISDGMLSGDTVEQMTRRLRGDVVKRATWKTIDGKRTYVPGQYEGGALEDVSTRQARTLARTAVMHVGNQARETFYKENEDIIKGYQRVETLDGDTCLVCGADDGHVYGLDEPRPELPIHPDCLPGDALVSSGSRVAGVSKRKYKGDMFVIRTASGNEIRATPNHPILTRAGFVVAQGINLGDKLVCDAGIDRVQLIRENDNQVETSIENLFRSFFEAGEMASVEVPTSAEDFHGDGIDNEIAVIAANRELLNEAYPECAKDSSESILVRRRRAMATLESRTGGQLQFHFGFLAASRSFMSSARKSLAFLGACAVHALNLLFVRVAHGDAGLLECNSNIHAACPETLSNPPDPYPLIVKIEHFFKTRPYLCKSASGECKAPRGEVTADSVLGYTSLACELIHGLAGPVSFDKVVEIRKEYFSGHVYNLQSEDGYFIANHIITHNCRGVYVPVLKSFRELGLDMDEFPEGTRASMDGQVAESETYADRLEEATPAQRVKMLGPGRAALYEKGVGLDEMVKDGAQVPLEELAKKGKKQSSAA
jgi:hypothetical protein